MSDKSDNTSLQKVSAQFNPDKQWRDVFLGDVASEITVGFVGSMAAEYVEAGIPFLRSLNVTPLRIKCKEMKFISPEFHQRISKSRLSPGDVVIVRTGTPGACAAIPSWFPEANCSDLVIVRCGKQIDHRFLVYYINIAATEHVAAHLVGAVQQHFNVSSARSLRINLPPLKEQERVAEVLGCLDSKIDLLHRQNQTLETMAETLFRQWFLEAAEVHWTEYSVSDFVDHIKQGIQPGDHPSTPFLHYSLPAFDAGQRPVVESGSQILSNKFKVPEGVLLVSKLNPRVSRIWPIDKLPTGAIPICSTEFQVLKPKNPAWFGYLYGVLTSGDARDALTMAASGTSGSHQRVRPEDILAIRISLPSIKLAETFSDWVKPALLKRQSNIEQITALERLRDALLPKLMSGEVRVTIP